VLVIRAIVIARRLVNSRHRCRPDTPLAALAEPHAGRGDRRLAID
jgi:hypothetical protein